MTANELAGWTNFYVIVGGSAGALIGLQFVAISLIADMPLGRGSLDAGNAFATPTIVHFGSVLFLSGLMAAPWPSMSPVVLQWALLGLYGFIYSLIVIRRVFRQSAYRPELEDWLFHAVLPCAAYATLIGAAAASRSFALKAPFAVAASAFLLLFIGIHNAWDAVTYHIFVVRKRHHQSGNAPDQNAQTPVSPAS